MKKSGALTSVYRLISEDSGTKTSKVVGIFIQVLILGNIIAIIFESFSEISQQYRAFFDAVELYSVAIFTVEYFLRLLAVLSQKKQDESTFRCVFNYAKSAAAIIDLLAILPFYFPYLIAVDLRFLRILRISRVLRVFKLQRYSAALGLLASVLKRKKEELTITLVVTFLMILFSATVMYYVENDVQPDRFPNIIASMWWSIATLTTIGYGDLFPITELGKIMGAVISILGIGLIALPTGIISSGFMEEINSKKACKKERPCPHCGKNIPNDD